MKSVFIGLAVIMLSVPAYAFDSSNCETIGHLVGTATESICERRVDCPTDDCTESFAGTPECTERVAQLNATAEKTVLMRCAATPELMEKKEGEKYTQYSDNSFVMTDGASVSFDELINDAENVYVIYKPAGQNGTIQAFAETGETWSVIGVRDENGFFLRKID